MTHINEILAKAWFYADSGVMSTCWGEPPDKLLNLDEYYSLTDFLSACENSLYFTTTKGWAELERPSVWIDDELMEYSLKGLESIKV